MVCCVSRGHEADGELSHPCVCMCVYVCDVDGERERVPGRVGTSEDDQGVMVREVESTRA